MTIVMVGEVRFDPKIGKFRGHLTADNGEATMVLFTCVAEKPENAREMVNGYAVGVVKRGDHAVYPVAWTKEWEVETA